MSVYRAATAIRDALRLRGAARPRVRPFDIALAYHLAAHADVHGICYPAVETLALDLGCHPGQIRKARARLTDAGMVQASLVSGGKGHTNTYRLPLRTVVARSAGSPQPAPYGAGSVSTTRAARRAPTANPRPPARQTRAGGRDQVGQEVEGEKRSAAAQRRRVIFNIHRPNRRAS